MEHICSLGRFTLDFFVVDEEIILRGVERKLVCSFQYFIELCSDIFRYLWNRGTRHICLNFDILDNHAIFHELVQLLPVLKEVALVDIDEFALDVESSGKLLHVRIIRFLVDASHFEEISSFIIEEAHDILQHVFTQFVKDGGICLDCSLGSP